MDTKGEISEGTKGGQGGYGGVLWTKVGTLEIRNAFYLTLQSRIIICSGLGHSQLVGQP